jgi:very-short-patch-repair endonuclease
MDPELAVALLAERQHGVFTRVQALKCGVSSSSIDRRLRLGTWERLHQGTYRLAGTERSFEQSIKAACLAGGPRSIASHRSAAGIYSLPGIARRVEITVPRSRRVEIEGVTVHRAHRMDAVDRLVEKRIPVTSVARTLIDLSDALPGQELTVPLDYVLAHRMVPLRYLWDRLDALGNGRQGAGTLAKLLIARSGDARQPQSDFERRLREVLGGAGLPAPEPQYPVRLRRGRMAYLDFAYPGACLALEADSYVHHSSLTDWSLDHARNTELVALGWRVLSVTYRELELDPVAVADQVGRALAAAEVRSSR